MNSNIIPFPQQQPVFTGCTACTFYKTCQGQVLHGVGPENARVMLVGEAPGANEARQGLPFIGEAGQLLNKLLTRAGLHREQVFVTNAVRCSPIGKKKPDVQAINACRQYLVNEIERVKPEMIIALGNYPLRSLCGVSGITKYRGQMQRLAKKSFGEVDIPVMPTFHPAFALEGRSPHAQQDIVQDLVTAMRHLDGGFKTIDTPFTLYPQAAENVPDLTSPLWSFDIETNARPPEDENCVTWFLAIDDGQNIVLFPPGYVSDAVALMKSYYDGGGNLVGHNSSGFDRVILKELYDTDLRCHDTQLLAHLLDEEQSLKLENLAVKYLGVEPWKDGFDAEFWRTWDTQSEERKRESFLYNARDTRYTRLLFEALWSESDEKTQRLYARHNVPCSRALATMEHTGVFLSQENITKAMEEIEVDRRVAELHLKNATRPDFNPGSYQQVQEVLFSDMLLPTGRETDSGEPSTSVDVLKKLQSLGLGGSVLQSILDYRKATKLLGYLRDYDRRLAASVGGFIYPSYSMTSTVNLRTSAFNPNLQNVPRDPRVRSCIAAPPGYVLMEVDASQLELRVAAERAGPQSALFQEYLKPKPDVHMTMAMRLTGKRAEDVTPAERSDAKPANFGFLYYGDEKTYMNQALTEYDRVIQFEDATHAKMAFRAWGIEPWWRAVEEELEEYGEVTSIFGAVRRLPQIRSRDRYTKLEALREAINFDDASVASHLYLLMLAECVGRGYKVVGYIHDALLIYVRNDPDEIARTAADLKQAFSETVPQLVEQIFDYRMRVPLVADVKAGLHWGDGSILKG